MELKKFLTAGSIALTVALFGCGDERKEEKAAEERHMDQGGIENKAAEEKMTEPAVPATPEQPAPPAAPDAPATPEQPPAPEQPAAPENSEAPKAEEKK